MCELNDASSLEMRHFRKPLTASAGTKRIIINITGIQYYIIVHYTVLYYYIWPENYLWLNDQVQI